MFVIKKKGHIFQHAKMMIWKTQTNSNSFWKMGLTDGDVGFYDIRVLLWSLKIIISHNSNKWSPEFYPGHMAEVWTHLKWFANPTTVHLVPLTYTHCFSRYKQRTQPNMDSIKLQHYSSTELAVARASCILSTPFTGFALVPKLTITPLTTTIFPEHKLQAKSQLKAGHV